MRAHQHEDNHKDYRAFFEHKELVLSVQHPTEIESPAIIEWFERVVANSNLSAPLSLKRDDRQENYQPITTFASSEAGTNYTLIYVSVDGGNADPEALLDNDVRMAADLQVLEVIDELNTRRGAFNKGQAITIRAASPNWLFSATPHQLVDGGPGGRPVDPGKIPVPDDYTIKCPLSEQKHAERIKAHGAQEPRSVAVAILDAVPPKDVYCNALDTISQGDNPLLYSTKSKLDIFRRDALGITLPVEPPTKPPPPYAVYTSHSANYEISDHGLFVAGTVNSIEPEAKLLLFEVLNHYGIGTVETIAKGIDQIWTNLKPTPEVLIVNLSLCVSFHSMCTLAEYYHRKSLIKGGTPYLDILLQPLQDAIYSLFATAQAEKTEVRIVAAAGNDGEITDLIPPSARYPAAFKRVLGVGALQEHVDRAPYSNLTDDPTSDGLMVFGGKIDGGNPPMSDAANGMLGLYIGNFPTDSTPPSYTHQSKYGWGRWSGTSFATGVMSGLLAQAARANFPVAQGATGDFVQALTVKVLATPFGERFLESWQGP